MIGTCSIEYFGAPTPTNGDTPEVPAFALEMAERTGGTLAPTLYPAGTGYEKIPLNGQTATVPDGMESFFLRIAIELISPAVFYDSCGELLLKLLSRGIR